MLREADIAYIAGLFDGEGSVTYKKYYETKKKRDGSPRKTYTWRIVLHSNHHWTRQSLEFLHQSFQV